MTTPATGTTMHVDVEVLVAQWLTAQTGIRTVRELPAEVETKLPIYQVTRVSGAPGDYKLDRPVIDLDSWGTDRDATSLIARQAENLMENHLPYADLAGLAEPAVVTAVRTVVAPRWLPDENTFLRRMNASYALVVHPR